MSATTSSHRQTSRAPHGRPASTGPGPVDLGLGKIAVHPSAGGRGSGHRQRAVAVARSSAARCQRLAAHVVVVVAFGAGRAAADPVAVKVVDVAGGAAYLSPGRAAGIVPGTRIRLHGVELVVVEVTEKTAMVRLGTARVAIGEPGSADVTPGASSAMKPLDRRSPEMEGGGPAGSAGGAGGKAPRGVDKPRPPDAFRGQWADPVLPATHQRPIAVPLGAAGAPGEAHVTVIGHAFGAVDRAHSAADAEGRVIASFDVMTDRPLAADLDLAGRWFSDGFDRHTRTPVLVRAAQLRYGDAADPGLAIGRLRFAASVVGMLDGGRASARVGAVELAAFGGLVPDPLSGKPDTGAARFGGELTYDAADAPWQPHVAITAHGSTWDGQLDERRLSVAASGDRGSWWLDGWAEAQAFAAGNPWGAGSVELTGAGATAQWREHGSHAGLDLTFLRPERSLRLAAALPPAWLCTLVPQGTSAETCAAGDWWGSATASLGTRTPRWAIDAGGTLGDSHGQVRGTDRSGYLRGELRAGPGRLIAGLAGGQASFASWTAGELGAAYARGRTLDVALTYRPELLDYVASTAPRLMHSVIADARFALSTAFDLALSAIATAGGNDADRDALAVLATFVWRPLP